MIEQNLGVLLNMRGNLAAAEARYSHSLGSFDGANDEEAVSWVLNNIGMLYTKLGHYQRAIETLERGLAIAKARGDALVESILTLNLAEVWVAVGKLDQAEQACRASFDSASSRGDHLTIAGALKCRARIERERGSLRRQHRDAANRDLRSGRPGRQAAPGRDAARVWPDLEGAGQPG